MVKLLYRKAFWNLEFCADVGFQAAATPFLENVRVCGRDFYKFWDAPVLTLDVTI